MRIHPADTLLKLATGIVHSFDKRDRSLDCFETGSIRTILIISSTGLGDTLLSTPSIKSVRQRYPAARIIAFLNAGHRELFADNPDIDLIIPYYGGYRRFLRTIRELRALRPDAAVILHGNEPQATPYAYFSGARFIIKVPRPPEYRYLFSNPDNGFADVSVQHAIDIRLKAVSFLGCETNTKQMFLNVDDEDEAFVGRYFACNELSDNHLLIGFQTGAAKEYKVWPDTHFIDLGKRLLAKNPDIRIVLTGARDEAGRCNYIAGQINGLAGKRAVSVAGRIPLKPMRALLKRLSVLVTNDTGTMHMAVALGARSISLFCPTDYRCFGPLSDLHLHRVVAKEKPCIPCKSEKCRKPFCMKLITVDEVMQAIEQMGVC